jgi:electron transfer flavoprotein alpha subunit
LLTDRALAGSDTLATARALALVLQRQQPDVIVCGRNSTDAETGQVGPELAELLGLPHISQVRKLTCDGPDKQLVAERLTDEGHEVVSCALPALVCVTEGVARERYPGPVQMQEAQAKPLEEMHCADLTANTALFGVEGSPTWVEDIRLVASTRAGMVINESDPVAAAQQVAALLQERLAALAADTSMPTPAVSRRYPGQRQRSIWVMAETVEHGLRQVTFEMLGKARALSAATQSEVVAVLLVPPQEQWLQELAAYGADRVLLFDPTPPTPLWGRAASHALAAAVQATPPYAVFCAATANGRDLAARLAARLQLGLTGDVSDLEINALGQLVHLKPALGGNVIAPILSKTLPNLVTLRPGMLLPITPQPNAMAVIEHFATAITFTERDVTVLERHPQEQGDTVALTQAQIVMGIGLGLGGPEHLPTIQALAHTLGATLATTRNVVHAGWLPHHIQVGISGRAIAPRVYLAVGIRGAFNHTVGVQKAGVIIALNENPRAAIFKAADVGIVGKWETYLPPLVQALQPVLSAMSCR